MCRIPQQVRVAATKPNELSVITRTYVVEGEERLRRWSSDLHMHAMPCMCICIWCVSVYIHTEANTCSKKSLKEIVTQKGRILVS